MITYRAPHGTTFTLERFAHLPRNRCWVAVRGYGTSVDGLPVIAEAQSREALVARLRSLEAWQMRREIR